MKVLMVVDLQKGFMNQDNYVELSEKIQTLLQRTTYDKVIFTKFINKPGSMYEKFLKWSKLETQQEQDIAIDMPENSEIWEKYGYGLQRQDIEKIKAMNIDKVDICGLQTDACVYAISFQLFDNRIFPNILINYVATNPTRETQAKIMLIHQFGSVDERQF